MKSDEERVGRSRLRIHLITAVMLMFFAAVMVWANLCMIIGLRGNPSWGFPKPYKYDLSASNFLLRASEWKTVGLNTYVNSGHLYFNVIVGFLCLLLLAIISEVSVRKLKGKVSLYFQFRLITLFVVTLTASTLLIANLTGGSVHFLGKGYGWPIVITKGHFSRDQIIWWGMNGLVAVILLASVTIACEYIIRHRQRKLG